MPLGYCVPVSFENIDPTLTVPNVVFDNEQVISGTLSIAAIEANWDAPTNPYVIGIQFEWTPLSGSATTSEMVSTTDGALHWKTTNAIGPQKTYACRWRAYSINAWGVWSVPVNITTLANVNWYDLRGFLEAMPKNLWRFDHFVGENGATTEGTVPTAPIATGEMGRAHVLPGTNPAVAIRRTDTKARYDLDRFAKYTMSFIAWVDTGTATLTESLVDDGTSTPMSSGVEIEGVATSSKTFALTTTPTFFKMERIRGSSAGFITSDWLLWNDGGWTSGQTVRITDLQLFYALDDVPGDWRPSIDEDWLTYWGELIQETMIAWRASHPNQKMITSAVGDAWTYTPHGAADIYQLEADYQLGPADAGAYLWSEEATPINVLFPNDSTYNYPLKTTVTLSKRGAGNVVPVEDTGVTIVPNNTNVLTISTLNDVVQFKKVGANLWHAI